MLLTPKCGSGGLVYALREWLFSYYFRGQVAHTSAHMGMHKCFGEQVIASIICDGHSEMSVITFCTAPPIGRLACSPWNKSYSRLPEGLQSFEQTQLTVNHSINFIDPDILRISKEFGEKFMETFHELDQCMHIWLDTWSNSNLKGVIRITQAAHF